MNLLSKIFKVKSHVNGLFCDGCGFKLKRGYWLSIGFRCTSCTTDFCWENTLAINSEYNKFLLVSKEELLHFQNKLNKALEDKTLIQMAHKAEEVDGE